MAPHFSQDWLYNAYAVEDAAEALAERGKLPPGGYFWHYGGWNGIGAFIGGLLVIALLVALRLAKLPALPGNTHNA